MYTQSLLKQFSTGICCSKFLRIQTVYSANKNRNAVHTIESAKAINYSARHRTDIVTVRSASNALYSAMWPISELGNALIFQLSFMSMRPMHKLNRLCTRQLLAVVHGLTVHSRAHYKRHSLRINVIGPALSLLKLNADCSSGSPVPGSKKLEGLQFSPHIYMRCSEVTVMTRRHVVGILCVNENKT